MQHRSKVTLNTDGSLSIKLVHDMHAATAASFVGATPTVTCTNPNAQELDIVISLVAGAPVTQQTAVVDRGGTIGVGNIQPSGILT